MIIVDSGSPVRPFEQIRGQLADLIRSGSVEGGQRLPSIRQLAADLRVAPGTVAKAYAELEEAGLITTSRAHGTRVRAGQTTASGLLDAALVYATAARSVGVDLTEALAAVRAQWA